MPGSLPPKEAAKMGVADEVIEPVGLSCWDN